MSLDITTHSFSDEDPPRPIQLNLHRQIMRTLCYVATHPGKASWHRQIMGPPHHVTQCAKTSHDSCC
jgi:hypothetical protein